MQIDFTVRLNMYGSMGLFSYLQRYKLDNLKHVTRNVYCTRKHESFEKIGEVRAMSDKFRFENLVDVYNSIFREYLSSVIAKLPESNKGYRAIQEQKEAIFQQYPKVLEAVDTETAEELSEQECAALIKIMEFKKNLKDIEMQTVYFQGCYDGVGDLKKAGLFLYRYTYRMMEACVCLWYNELSKLSQRN